MWIEHVEYAQSEGYLRTLYDRVKGPNGAIDNVMKVHSLRPHTMEGLVEAVERSLRSRRTR